MFIHMHEQGIKRGAKGKKALSRKSNPTTPPMTARNAPLDLVALHKVTRTLVIQSRGFQVMVTMRMTNI
eukprot:2449224-Amphidinium_carterae.1